MRVRTFFRLFAACVIFAASAAFAQTYPNHVVRIILPYPPGGSMDALGRMVFDRLSQSLGQQFVIDYRPGASGNIGSEIAAHAAPDGHTLLLNTLPFVVNPSLYKKMPFDTIKDFAPVSLLATSPFVLVVHPSVPAKTLKDFIALARAAPGELRYGSAGNGSGQHLAGEMLNVMARIKTVHIPYKGQGPALTDLLSGQVSMLYSSIPSVIQQVKSGQLRALAVGSAKRLPSLPDIPTLAESGVPGYEAYSWVGLVAPAHTPADIVKKIHRDVSEILKDKEVAEKLNQQGALPVGDTPEEFGLYIKNEIAKWGKVVRDANIKAD